MRIKQPKKEQKYQHKNKTSQEYPSLALSMPAQIGSSYYYMHIVWYENESLQILYLFQAIMKIQNSPP